MFSNSSWSKRPNSFWWRKKKQHKKTVQQVYPQTYTCACACQSKFLILEQNVWFSWCKRKQEYARTLILQGYVTLHTHIIFFDIRCLQSQDNCLNWFMLGQTAWQFRYSNSLSKSNCCHYIICESSEMTTSWQHQGPTTCVSKNIQKWNSTFGNSLSLSSLYL